jgi:cytochrome c peroxidase
MWNGSIDRLEDQARKSIETTMRGKAPSAGQVADLTAYLRSLPPPKPRPIEQRPDAVERGRAVFRSRRCAECHAPPDYTAQGLYDVGLSDEVGTRKFNPPSLRGLNGREPFLHDGRAATLDDVFLRHRHPRGATWSPHEVADLVAFLETL